MTRVMKENLGHGLGIQSMGRSSLWSETSQPAMTLYIKLILHGLYVRILCIQFLPDPRGSSGRNTTDEQPPIAFDAAASEHDVGITRALDQKDMGFRGHIL